MQDKHPIDTIKLAPGELALADSITFATSKGSITIDLTTGEVSYPENLTQAAKEFWDILKKIASKEKHD